MPLNQFGTYSPQIIEPSQAENTVLANLLSRNPSPLAPGQLALTNEMHNVGQAQYNAQLGVQRDLAMRQIQASMAEQYIKGLDLATKAPGVAPLMASGPFYQQFFGGADPNAISQFVTDSQGNIALGQQKTASEAAKGYADAGVAPPLTTLGGMTNTNLQPAMSIPERVATIRGQYDLAAAQAGGPAMREIDVPTGILGPDFKPITAKGIKYNIYWPQDVRDAAIRDQVNAWLKANNIQTPRTQTTSMGGPAVPPTPGTASTGQGTPGQPPLKGADASVLLGGTNASTGQPTNPLGGISGGQTYEVPGLKPATPQQNAIALGGSTDTTATTTQPPSTGSVLPGAQAAEPQTQASTGQTSASAASPGQAQAPIKLVDTQPGQVETSAGGKTNIMLQGKARQMLPRVSPEARDAITEYRGKSGGDIPIRIIGGVPYIIHPKTGQRLVPLT